MRNAAKYSPEVIDLVEADINYGLTVEQTKLYLKRNIKYPQMKLLSQCLRRGADEAFIELVTKYDMSGYQIQVALEFLEKGVSLENIETVLVKNETPANMRKSFEVMLEKVKEMRASSEVTPEYVRGLVKQIEEAVAKIQFQEQRYDELNKKLKIFENAKQDEAVHNGLVKKLGETEAELSGQQDQLNRANATIARLREQIEEKKKDGWEFLFIGANIDAAEEASRIGISRDRAANYISDSIGTGAVYTALSESMSCMRKHGAVAKNWNENILKDAKRRKK